MNEHHYNLQESKTFRLRLYTVIHKNVPLLFCEAFIIFGMRRKKKT